MDKYKFIAKKVNFQSETGYMLNQIQLKDGLIICSQFISEDNFSTFCEIFSITPEIID